MLKIHILQFEQMIKGRLIENSRSNSREFYKFECDRGIVQLEFILKAGKMASNYEICTNELECWNGYRDIREVKKHISLWLKGQRF